ncbi:MAG TPA: biotin carboxylase N-terminal domain-containing protein [Brevundimonas sp.]|jgi:propionyl-CoA carboxylase alpha chain/3-methylcrotonyl-CoA carboxylase alpha subunit|uniref:acetyl/propionyl/methylcrotonyl-CoA carboxylase subunit alpha n=1 Tax=Brevundimonas sp. TaxID=1871086 RepID=UPI002DF16693|nr:biotin carboxylase N-terminal domain-containing protein [Brevundimonas sp.]
MFKSVLVANRGEIACRVFRTARRMGLRTIAVHSEADADALHVGEADQAVLIGPAPARDSYLDAVKVLQAAKDTGAEAIHPGYGFLSENADFAEAVEAAGLIWIGPKPHSIRAMGLKDAAKKLMIEAGVPVTPGYQGEDQSIETLTAEAQRIGFPVLIKAVAGGGGKGMKLVERAEDFADGLASAQREGQSSFGDPRVLIESYITRPRHIEVQVFGDGRGEVVHLFERDCSLQRRHQKVIEEAPAPGMDAATRDAVTAAAVRAAKAVDYRGAGTIEFIADASDGLRADRIWFMEMNTRLQVEHPVTEAITGVDLVEWQFRVAAGEPIPLKQEELSIKGWAMEARLYAEDPATGFLPSIGKLEHFILPRAAGEGDREAVEGAATRSVRVDTGAYEGGEVSQFYDPMIAKLIVHEDTREAAAQALADACAQVEVWPVRTNAGFLVRCLEHPRFVSGDVDTGFIAAEGEGLMPTSSPERALAAVGLYAEKHYEPGSEPRHNDYGAWDATTGALGFRLNAEPRGLWVLEMDGERVERDAISAQSHDSTWLVQVNGKRVPVRYDCGNWGHGSVFVGDRTFGQNMVGDDLVLFDRGQAVRITPPQVSGASGSAAASDGALRAPMPGKIVSVPIKAGDAVTKGQPVVALEAMKMEHALTAPFDGTVEAINVTAGDQVAADAVLAVVKAKD